MSTINTTRVSTWQSMVLACLPLPLCAPPVPPTPQPMLSLQGLTAAHTILRLVPPPLGPWRLDGPIHIKQAPPPPGHNNQVSGVGSSTALNPFTWLAPPHS